MNKAVFLDRDGVINRKHNDYVKNINEFIMLQDIPKAVKLLNEKNYLVIIITNQSAINRGLLTHEDLARIHEVMKDELKKHGSFLDAIYYCPHRPDENCRCRKPQTGLVEQAIKEYSISAELSWFIGDSETDMLTARKMKIQEIKIKENGNLLDAVSKICNSKIF